MQLYIFTKEELEARDTQQKELCRIAKQNEIAILNSASPPLPLPIELPDNEELQRFCINKWKMCDNISDGIKVGANYILSLITKSKL